MYKRPQELESQALEELGISKDEYDAYPDAVKAIVANHLVNGPPRKRLNVGQFAEMEITTDEAVIAKLEEMGEGLPKETKRVKTLSECFTGPDGQRLFLRLMRAESLSLAMLDKIEPLALRSSSSRLEYKTIAPLFGLNPTLRGRDMGTIDIQYARLPSKVWLEVLQSVDMAEQMLGEFDLHENEQARSQWIDAWFRPIIALFESRVRKVPHSSSGRMESQFFMDTIRMLRLIVTNHSLTDNKEFVNQMAQIMGELNVSAYRNGKNSMEINPINGILTDGEKYFVFEYNHETRTFKKSYPLRVNTDNSATIARSMEEVCGMFYHLLLQNWEEGLRAFRRNSKSLGTNAEQPRRPSPSPRKWWDAENAAGAALQLATGAHNEDDGRQAVDAVRRLKRSLQVVPGLSGESFLTTPSALEAQRRAREEEDY